MDILDIPLNQVYLIDDPQRYKLHLARDRVSAHHLQHADAITHSQEVARIRV